MPDLKTTGESIYDLSLKVWDLNFEIQKLERELKETDIYKKIQWLKNDKKEVEDSIEARKAFVKERMLDAGLKSMEFTNQKVTLKKSPWKLVIEDETVVPEEYKKEKVTVSIDKKKLKDVVSKWELELPWVEIEYWYSLLITPKE